MSYLKHINQNNYIRSNTGIPEDYKTGVTFDDVAGIDEAKAELEEIVSFLYEPERYTALGARIPNGALLVGPPGTGKTLLAKAISTEAGVPFFAAVGSEFVEMYIGVGASRIRELFDEAVEYAPSIVFIDEIDAVGRKRGAGLGSGSEEKDQTLNQLLVEMDGFEENRGVIVIGATNRADILDPALVRAGRFDRTITLGLPDRAGRIDILKIHAKNKPLDKGVSLAAVARRTPGFSGADLAGLLNEAAILATRYGKTSVTDEEIQKATERILYGIARSPMENTPEKIKIAYREASYGLVASILEYHNDVDTITLIPRGETKGLTWYIAGEDDDSLISRAELFANMTRCLAGRIAEEVVFGLTQTTVSTSSVLQQAQTIATDIVVTYAMSSIGVVYVDDEGEPFSELTTVRIEQEMEKILTGAEHRCRKIISENRPILDVLVDILLTFDSLDGQDVRYIINLYTNLPITKKPFKFYFNNKNNNF